LLAASSDLERERRQPHHRADEPDRERDGEHPPRPIDPHGAHFSGDHAFGG
jgi:hypothetical protein